MFEEQITRLWKRSEVDIAVGGIGREFWWSSPPRVLADPEPHDQENGRDDETELNDEGIQVGRRLGDDASHQVNAAAGEIVEFLRAQLISLVELSGIFQQIEAVQSSLGIVVWLVVACNQGRTSENIKAL